MAHTTGNSVNSQKPQNLNSKQSNGTFTGKKQQFSQNGSQQQRSNGGKKQSRNEKRRRWAKKHKVAPKPVVKRGPVKEYVSACCSLPAIKPVAGEKFTARDPETGKMAEQRRGLGKFRCTGCKKIAKVTPRKPEVKEVPNNVPSDNAVRL